MRLLLALLLLVSPVWAQDPPTPPVPVPPTPAPVVVEPFVSLPDVLKVDVGDFIVVSAKTNGKKIKWKATGQGYSPLPAVLINPEMAATNWVAIAKNPGVVTIEAVTALGDEPSDIATCVVTIGNPAPPVPPTPNPPLPPGPVSADPFKPSEVGAVPGFRFLIVHETADDWKLPPKQAAIATSAEIYAYAAEKCVKGPDGKTPDVRVWDKDVNVSNVSALWQRAMSLPRQSLPWIVIGTGTTGYEGPLPADVDSTLALLKKYGG